jgi:hypothetical protein
MELSEAQARVVQLAANAELRTPQQMLSLLLAEGVTFYFIDREQIRGGAEFNIEEAERILIEDAICQIAVSTTHS